MQNDHLNSLLMGLKKNCILLQKGAIILTFHIFGSHIEFSFCIQFWWAFFLWIYCTEIFRYFFMDFLCLLQRSEYLLLLMKYTKFQFCKHWSFIFSEWDCFWPSFSRRHVQVLHLQVTSKSGNLQCKFMKDMVNLS